VCLRVSKGLERERFEPAVLIWNLVNTALFIEQLNSAAGIAGR